MSAGIYTAAAGAIARQAQLDVVSNNLANAGTRGYKALRVGFSTVLGDETGRATQFVGAKKTSLDVRAGALLRTGNPLDLALGGPGFFLMEGEGQQSGRGRHLRRSISLRVSADGTLVDIMGGRPVSRGGTPITIDPNRPVEVMKDGEVRQDGDVLGRFAVVDVEHPEALAPQSAGVYADTAASGPVFGIPPEIMAGTLEKSNVQPVTEMVQLIKVERGFQSLIRAMGAYRQLGEQLANTVRNG